MPDSDTYKWETCPVCMQRVIYDDVFRYHKGATTQDTCNGSGLTVTDAEGADL